VAPITLDDVHAAARRLAGVAHRTPVLRSRTLDERVGATVLLKAEGYQRTGSFKFRGAFNRISSIPQEDTARGVVAWSSGNHAQAVALAAALRGAPATIVMPEDAPASKVAATQGYGAEVVRYDRYHEDREAVGRKLVAERGLTDVPPYDHPLIMAGQGTAALELVQDAGRLDVLLVCVGGGGLIAGCATAVKGLHPDTRVIGVEPAAGDDVKRSLEAGERVRIPIPHTICDGQQIDIPGALTFPVIRELVDEVRVATDEQVVDAMRFLFERMKVVAEPSGACALAALLADPEPFGGLRVGVTLSGANVGVDRFVELLGA
jgi:threo-3-hydroxy-L-aspartate ammonia-lyase